MNTRPILLDLGGVIVDNTTRHDAWTRLLGEFMHERLGGDRARWDEANAVAWQREWARWEAERGALSSSKAEYEWWRHDRRRWLADMCEHAGVGAPDGAAADALIEAAERFVKERIVEQGVPGAVDAVRALAARGHRLVMASGNESGDIARMLGHLGIRDLFATALYGPDLAGAPKAGPGFYERICALERIEPRDALVVDDSSTALRWAASLGLRGELVTAERPLARIVAELVLEP